MVTVMGGSRETQPFRWFEELCVKSFLVTRAYAETIIQSVTLMLESGLPCFKGEKTITNLRSRFVLEKDEREAAAHMLSLISFSYENRRTKLYDQFQKATNGNE